MRWMGLVACMGIFWVENVKGRDHLEDLSMDGKIILEWILGKWAGRVWTGCIGSG
jgi:hypothetical protein